jgi:hypothetical protein
VHIADEAVIFDGEVCHCSQQNTGRWGMEGTGNRADGIHSRRSNLSDHRRFPSLIFSERASL